MNDDSRNPERRQQLESNEKTQAARQQSSSNSSNTDGDTPSTSEALRPAGAGHSTDQASRRNDARQHGDAPHGKAKHDDAPPDGARHDDRRRQDASHDEQHGEQQASRHGGQAHASAPPRGGAASSPNGPRHAAQQRQASGPAASSPHDDTGTEPTDPRAARYEKAIAETASLCVHVDSLQQHIRARYNREKREKDSRYGGRALSLRMPAVAPPPPRGGNPFRDAVRRTAAFIAALFKAPVIALHGLFSLLKGVGSAMKGVMASRAFSWILTLFMLMVALVLVALPALAVLGWLKVSDVQAGIRCATSHMLVEDAEGHVMGLLVDYNVRDRKRKIDTRDGTARKTDCPEASTRLRSNQVRPLAYANPYSSWNARALEVLEGDFLSTHWNVLWGIDLFGIPRALYYKLQGRTIGGSNPIVTAVEVVTNQPQASNFVFKVLEKLTNYFTAAFYTAIYLDTDERRLEFLLNFLPCVTGVGEPGGGLSIAGRECPRLFFGKRFSQLDPAEACIWASSIKTHHFGTRTRKEHWGIGKERVRKISERAKLCIQRFRDRGWINEADFKKFTSKISGWQPRLYVHPSPSDGKRPIFNIQPYSTYMPGLSLILRRELRNYAPTSDVVRLTLLAKPQALFIRDIRENLPTVSSVKDTERAAFLMEITDHGELVMRIAYGNHSQAYRQPGHSLLQASLNKPWVAIQARQSGITSLCTTTANRPCTAAEQVGISPALARSLNAPFIWAVKRIGIDRVKAMFASMEYKVHPHATARGLALGYQATISTRLLLRNWAHLHQAVLDRDETLQPPTLFAGEHDTDNLTQPFRLPFTAQLPRYRAMLAAPYTSPAGTLRQLYFRLREEGCTPVIGKTGTTEVTQGDQARGRVVVATFTCNGRHFVAYARIDMRKDEPLPAADKSWPIEAVTLAARYIQTASK